MSKKAPVVFIGTYTGKEASHSFVANQNTHNLISFKIDQESGELSRTGYEIEVSMPVCVKFAYLEE